jgi:S1-C subfamily serine protease
MTTQPFRQASNGDQIVDAAIRPTAMKSSYDDQMSQYQRSVYTATVVGIDPGKDIAVLKVDAPESVLYPIDIGTSTGLKVGQNAYAIGNRKFVKVGGFSKTDCLLA